VAVSLLEVVVVDEVLADEGDFDLLGDAPGEAEVNVAPGNS
jgi:hypothetical protein